MMFWLWAGFLFGVILLLILDLGVFHRQAHAIGVREALAWSAVWFALALFFGIFVYFAYRGHWLGLDVPHAEPDGGPALALYLTGYVVEKSLSVDNVFVMALIFAYFGVPAAYQHRVLFWGILGALAMRGALILAGAVLIARFDWIFYVFGVFLLFTAVRMLLASSEPDPQSSIIVRLARRYLPFTHEFVGARFVVRDAGRWVFTPLALTLVMVEVTDLLFAVDSIPAVFAVTQDPFLVFTSNVFAILGLRSLYFALAGVMDRFHYLKMSLAVLVALIGLKMLLHDLLHTIPGLTYYTLAVVTLVLAGGVAASLVRARRMPVPAAPD